MAAAQIPHRVVTEVDLESTPASRIRGQLRKAAGVLLSRGRESRCRFCEWRRADLRRIAFEGSRGGFPSFSPEYLMLQGDITFPLGKSFNETTLIGVFHGTDSSSTDGLGLNRSMSGCPYEFAAVRKDEVRIAPMHGGTMKHSRRRCACKSDFFERRQNCYQIHAAAPFFRRK